MIRLIKGEFKKIFHKKSLYIVIVLFLLFTGLTNFVYKSMNSPWVDDTVNIEEYKNINNNLDLTKSEDLEEYVSNLVIIETEELKTEYKTENQKYLINNKYYDILYNTYVAKYITKDEAEYKELDNNRATVLEKIKNDDWEYFAKKSLDNRKEALEKANTSNKVRLEEMVRLAEYRIANKVNYASDNYLNNAILELEENMVEYYNLKAKDTLTKDEKGRFKNIEADYYQNHYILDHQVDANNASNLKSVLENFHSEFSLFILIFIIMISGVIVSEEFSKGTIKSLLTKPYTRTTILLSKLLTILIFIPLLLVFMLASELIIGGIILGFNSLNIPVLIFNSSTHTLLTINIFVYLIKSIIAVLPMYLILALVCFLLSTVTASTSAAITITFLFYLAGNIVNNLAMVYNIPLLKFFVSLHWDFSYLVNYTTNPYKMATWTSVLVLILYSVVMLCIAFVYFNKKDVKNI